MGKILKNCKTNKKLLISFGIVIVCCLVIGIASIVVLWDVGDSMEYFYNTPYRNSVAQLQMQSDTQSIMKNLLWSCTTDDPEEIKSLLADMEKDKESQQEQLEFIKQNSKETDLIAELETKMAAAQEIRDNVEKYSQENDVEGALKEFNEEYAPRINEVLATMKQLDERSQDDANRSRNESKTLRIVTYIVILVLLILSLGLSVYLVIVITKLLVKPIQQLDRAMLQMSGGDFEIEVDYESKDELGSLAHNFRHMAAFLKSIIGDLNYLFENLAEGNFNVRTKQEQIYIGEFNPILHSLREMVAKISSALNQINESSEQVSLGSGQMAESAQGLAEGAADQAGSVQELQATISTVLEQTERNTEKSRETAEKASSVKTEVVSSNQNMAEMMAAMDRIKETSAHINNIVGEIEDIASQTNLLSLNASIEAARAGEAGRGFAVVADQIRKLAEDSEKSAVNTRDLIENSISEVKNGNNIAKRTAAALAKVIESIEVITGAVQQNREASQEQEDAMMQIEQGIEQISGVVQSNSAAAEEASATSEELAAQAENLKVLVRKFKLRA